MNIMHKIKQYPRKPFPQCFEKRPYIGDLVQYAGYVENSLEYVVNLDVDAPVAEIIDFLPNIKSDWSVADTEIDFSEGKSRALVFSFAKLVDATYFKINFSDYYARYNKKSIEYLIMKKLMMC
jgi:hypothetical protein